MGPPKLEFNFSTVPAATHAIYKKSAGTRNEQVETEGSVGDASERDNSPLFEPLDEGLDQVEVDPAAARALGAQKRINAMDPAAARALGAQKTTTMYHSAQNTRSVQTSVRNMNGKSTSHPDASHTFPQLQRKVFAYRDISGVVRDIWQPGDPDGEQFSEYSDLPIVKQRWRFFQSDLGTITRGSNSPPHYVALDDRAVWDVMNAAYTQEERGKYWALDFTMGGRVKAARLNKGRPALNSSEDTKDADQFVVVEVGDRKAPRKYRLSGERGGYKEVVFEPASAGSGTEDDTAVADQAVNRDDEDGAEFTGRRKTAEPLNTRYKRQRVEEEDPFCGSELSPQTAAGGRTVYARNDEAEPERKNGRVVAVAHAHGAKTPFANGANTSCVNRPLGAQAPNQPPRSGAKTPHPETILNKNAIGTEDEPGKVQPMWQVVKNMGEELDRIRVLLRARESEIAKLASIVSVERGQKEQALAALKVKNGENQELREEVTFLRRSSNKK